MFTIKIVKTRKGAPADSVSSASTNMFSLVDLAGSERQINTGTNGTSCRLFCNGADWLSFDDRQQETA